MAKPKNHPFNTNWILNPKYKRVSLVPEGANSEAHITLIKQKGGTGMNLEQILSLLKAEQATFIREELEKARGEVPEAMTDEMKEAKKVSDAEKKAAEEKIVSLEMQLKTAEVAKQEDPEELLKASDLDPALKAMMLTQITKAKAAEEVVRKMKDEQMTVESISKAKEVPNIAGDEAKVAELYKKLKNSDEALCEEVFNILKMANTLIEKGGAFSEVGKSGEGKMDGSEDAAWAVIEQKATEIAKTKNISQSKAVNEVMDQHPELYDAYVKAQNA